MHQTADETRNAKRNLKQGDVKKQKRRREEEEEEEEEGEGKAVLKRKKGPKNEPMLKRWKNKVFLKEMR